MPFELHFSKGHINWYKDDPAGYINTMKGTDKDLAAHCTIIRARGRCLKGCPIDEVFGEVPERDYADALWYDIEEAPEDILEDTMYITLNLARVMAWLRERKVLSKQEGGEWGLSNLPKEYHPLIEAALKEYKGEDVQYDLAMAKNYAEEIVKELKEDELFGGGNAEARQPGGGADEE
jgi:streptomycin 3"-adenylyltransferase